MLNGAHHRVRPLVEIEILHFLFLFVWYFFLIPYYLSWKHNNFQLNWTEGVACRNYTIFCMKFKPPSQLWVRCLRSWICASSHGQTRLGRHNISQRKKQQNTISTKARWSSPRGQNTIFQLNWTEGVDYRNFTIFSMKFEAPSQLRARWLRSRISESSRGQTWLGRHNRSQRKKNTTW
jgi:hypothetical protein